MNYYSYLILLATVGVVLAALSIAWLRTKLKTLKASRPEAEREQYLDTYRRLKARTEAKTKGRGRRLDVAETSDAVEPFHVPQDILEEKFGVEVPTEFKPRRHA